MATVAKAAARSGTTTKAQKGIRAATAAAAKAVTERRDTEKSPTKKSFKTLRSEAREKARAWIGKCKQTHARAAAMARTARQQQIGRRCRRASARAATLPERNLSREIEDLDGYTAWKPSQSSTAAPTTSQRVVEQKKWEMGRALPSSKRKRKRRRRHRRRRKATPKADPMGSSAADFDNARDSFTERRPVDGVARPRTGATGDKGTDGEAK